MYDRDLVIDILKQILAAADRITDRFAPIHSVDDFTNSPAGVEKLDAICMLLIAIGESLKNIDTITAKSVFPNYPEVDWKGAMGMRDIITHHYFDIDAEEIFAVCKNHIRPLAKCVERIISDLS